MRFVVIKYSCFLPPLVAAAALGVVVGGVEGFSVAAAFYILWSACFGVAMRYVRGMSGRFGWLLSLVGMLLIAGCALNISTWISPEGASLSHPALMNDYARDFYAAADFANTGQMSFYGNASYVTAMGTLFRVTSPNVAVPLIINSLLVLGTIIVGARMSAYLLRPERKREKSVTFLSGLAIATVANLILIGTVDLKDAGAVFSFTCMAFALAIASRGRLGEKGAWLATLGAVLMIVFKSQLAVFIIAGVFIVAFRKSKGSLCDCAYLIALSVVVLLCGHQFQMSVSVEEITSEHSLTGGMLALPSAGFYGKMMYEYYFWPAWVRVLLIPFTTAVQTLMPLPWHFERDMALGAFFPYGHFSFPWYAIVWALGTYYIFMFLRRGSVGLDRWAIFWLVCYCGVAFYSCGTTARYYLPFVPMAVPMALRAVQSVRSEALFRRSVKVWSTTYIVCLVVALTATYFMLKS